MTRKYRLGDEEGVDLSAFYSRLHAMNVDGWGGDQTYLIWAMMELEKPFTDVRRDLDNDAVHSAAL